MREPGSVVVALGGDEHLRLVLQSPERLRVHDPVAVALERGPQRAVALRLAAQRRIRGRRELPLVLGLPGTDPLLECLRLGRRGHDEQNRLTPCPKLPSLPEHPLELANNSRVSSPPAATSWSWSHAARSGSSSSPPSSRALPTSSPATSQPRRTTCATRVDALGLEIGLLVNNAGFGTHGPFVEQEAGREAEEVRVNCEAIVTLTHAFLPPMVERGRGGVIIVASTAGMQPIPYQAVYAATKAFALSFTDALHMELKGTGVRVMSVNPGPVPTEWQEVAGFDDVAVVPGKIDADQVVRESLAAWDRGTRSSSPAASSAGSSAPRRRARGRSSCGSPSASTAATTESGRHAAGGARRPGAGTDRSARARARRSGPPSPSARRRARPPRR